MINSKLALDVSTLALDASKNVLSNIGIIKKLFKSKFSIINIYGNYDAFINDLKPVGELYAIKMFFDNRIKNNKSIDKFKLFKFQTKTSYSKLTKLRYNMIKYIMSNRKDLKFFIRLRLAFIKAFKTYKRKDIDINLIVYFKKQKMFNEIYKNKFMSKEIYQLRLVISNILD